MKSRGGCWAVAAAVWCGLVGAGQIKAAEPSTQPERSPWEALDLASVSVQRGTLHYERSLEESVPAVVRQLEGFLKARERTARQAQGLLDESERILAGINRVIGGSRSPSFARAQSRMLGGLLKRIAEIHTPDEFNLVTRGMVKDYLRRGGSLPGFHYEKKSDTATFRFRSSLTSSRNSN